MAKKKVSVIITDLDNTLYDWFDVWYQSFSAMLNRLVQDSGVEEERLISEIKRIHEQHGTSEYLLLIEELPCLRDKHPHQNLSKIYAAVIEAYVNARSTYLHLYPSVLETLKTLKECGCLIVGYTESQAYYTEFRVKELGLDGIIDYLYSPPNHKMPQNLATEQNAF